MRHSTEGVSVTWFLYWEVALLFSFSLAYRAWKAEKNRITMQSLIIFANWLLLVTACLTMYLKHNPSWSAKDTRVSIVVMIGVSITLIYAIRTKKSLANPMIKTGLAVSFKSLPQLDLASRVLVQGGQGFSPVMIVSAHINICTRILQLVLARRTAPNNPEIRGNLINEILNETSWVAVAIALLFFQRALS